MEFETTDDLQPSSVIADADMLYGGSNPAWVKFNAQISSDIEAAEERFRPYWTLKTVRTALGR